MGRWGNLASSPNSDIKKLQERHTCIYHTLVIFLTEHHERLKWYHSVYSHEGVGGHAHLFLYSKQPKLKCLGGNTRQNTGQGRLWKSGMCVPGLKGTNTIQQCVATDMRECILALSALSSFYKKARNHILNVKFLSFLMLAPTFFLSNTGGTKYFCRLEVSFPSLSFGFFFY